MFQKYTSIYLIEHYKSRYSGWKCSRSFMQNNPFWTHILIINMKQKPQHVNWIELNSNMSNLKSFSLLSFNSGAKYFESISSSFALRISTMLSLKKNMIIKFWSVPQPPPPKHFRYLKTNKQKLLGYVIWCQIE